MSGTAELELVDIVRGRPTWLALEPEPVLVFLHQPSAAKRRSTAVLFCPPFGWEETCSYRVRRDWAQSLAQAGFPAARIDLPGTGDSAGNPRDPGRLAAWTRTVSGCAQWLSETTGAHRVVALGIGLGGMLACRAVAEDACIDDLILWATPARGRVLLRELRAYAGIVSARNGEDLKPRTLGEGDLELTGFLLGADTARDLERLDLTSLSLPPAERRRVLLLGRDGVAPDRQLRARLEQVAVVTIDPGNGYAAAVSDPQAVEAPRETIAATISWLQSEEPTARDGAPPPAVAGPIEHRSMELRSGEVAIRETPIRFEGEIGGLFGVLTEPANKAPAPVCAVLLNGGALRHTGPHRMWVEIARRWATRGVATVRVDLEGIGESDGEDWQPLSNRRLYDPQYVRQTLAVLDQLEARGLPNRFALCGLCSGAYWALHAALADSRVAGTFTVNLYSFYWSEELVEEREVQASLARLRGWLSWRRLVHEAAPGKIKTLARDSIPTLLRAAPGRPVERSQSGDIEVILYQLREQGTETLMLFSEGEPLYDQLARQSVLGRLGRWPNVTVRTIPSRDHLFRALPLQKHVHDQLDGALARLCGRLP